MSAVDLQRRLEILQDDYREVRGQSFNHFYCPILHTDEPAELCRGHIIPEAFQTSNEWLPQRKDIDGFYGSVTEADFIAVVKDRKKSPAEIWMSHESNRQHRPRIEFEGQALEHYFPKKIIPVAGQTRVEIVNENGQHISNVMVKLSFDEMMNLDQKDLQIVFERDYQPEVIASLLKSTHLTLFKMLGYQHVFSPTGFYLAAILRDFYLKYRDTPKAELKTEMASYFKPFSSMVVPVEPNPTFNGTLLDHRLIACCGQSGKIFSLAVVIKAGADMFCIFVPTDDAETVGTYFGFLNEPPPSIAVKIVRLVPATDQRQSYWELQKEEPFRIQMPKFGGH